MKKSEFKKIIKPIVMECIRESLIEGGILSGVISEVVRGMAPAPRIAPAPAPVDPLTKRMKTNAFSKEQSAKLQEQKKKLMGAIGASAYNGVNLFEGTSPGHAQGSPSSQAQPLSGQDPGDAGVDIGDLFGSVGKHWNAHMTEVKDGK